MAPAFIPTGASALRTTTFTQSRVCAPRVNSAAAAAAPAARPATLPAKMMSDPIDDELAWVDAVEVSQVRAGTTRRAVLANLDICIACANDGQVYAIANKGPPLGIPLSDGTITQAPDGTDVVKCSQYGTLFELATGDVVDGTWICKPPIVSNILRILFGEPLGIEVYPVRESDGMLQVLLNVKARAQYEQKYWKGILDASGKADGGYY